MKFYTVGYGGRKPEELLQILTTAGVRTVADVRLRPDRACMGVFVKAKSPDKGIERLLTESGIDYRSFVELGNVFLDCADWRPRYVELLNRAGDLLTARLEHLQDPICLLCCEKCVEGCHRQQIAEFLGRKGCEIAHL